MLKVQTIVLECPKRKKLAYQLSIDLTDFSPDSHQVSIVGPGDREVANSSTDGCVQFEQCDGPGVARFRAVVRDRSDNAEAKDNLTIEVLVLPETEKGVREAIGAAISAMKVEIWGGGHSPCDTAAEASRLQKSFGDMAAVELLRRLALDRANTMTVLRTLLLLRELTSRPAAPWLPPMVFAALGDLAGGISHQGTAECLLEVFERLALPAHEKWFYLMRAAQDLQYARGRAFSQLSKITPAELRADTAAAVLEICGLVVDGRQQACELFQEFCYAPAAPRVLEWMEADYSVIYKGCGFLIKVDYRAAAERLRSLFERDESYYVALANCLAAWQDTESVPVILKKLASIGVTYADDLVRILLRFDVDVVPQIHKIQRKSAPDKAKRIEQALEGR